jgi:predicted metal-binding protein
LALQQKREGQLDMKDYKELESLFTKHDFTDCKWIDPKDIIVAQWVRLKCEFGCGNYGKGAACPPNVPSVAECKQFFGEYTAAVIFHFEKTVGEPEDRHAWSREVNRALLALEREVFLSGYHKAFMLFMDSCSLCESCAESRVACKQPRLARPAPESMAVDVFTTVRRHGYPIQVLTDYTQPMNRYAFLLVE